MTKLTNGGDDGSGVVMTLNVYEAKTQLSSLVDRPRLIAQARVEGATIVTHDRAFDAYGVPVIWT